MSREPFWKDGKFRPMTDSNRDVLLLSLAIAFTQFLMVGRERVGPHAVNSLNEAITAAVKDMRG